MLRSSLSVLRSSLARPVDSASLVVFRVGFGCLAVVASVRFVALGWVELLLLQPTLHFPWIPGLLVPPAPVLYGLFGVQAGSGLLIAWGRGTRPALVAWLFSFGVVELLDKTLYLNHYVLFTLLGAWLLVSPVHRLRLHGGAPLAAGWLWLLRAQVASVYIWAGLAKLNGDWLLRGEPLHTWLSARRDLPGIGSLLAMPDVALAMSWTGAVYDLAIPLLLLTPRTRSVALAAVVGFHLSVGLLFPIGIFPALMVLSATLLCAPGWPRRWGGAVVRWEQPVTRAPAAAPWVVAVGLIVLVPARGLLHSGDINWTERGYRFSWRVMLNEKTGMVEYRVVEPATGRTWRASPSAELTPLQHQHMRTQPDMIRDHALHLAAQHSAEGRQVAVYADSFASLNGRPTQRLLRPDVDLTLSLPELWAAGWVVPLEAGGPRP